jgi:signal transduction histidine kinase
LQVLALDLLVLMDRGQFELMVLNIAANARDAMPDGGRFTMRLERIDQEHVLRLTLADTGIGMTDEVQAKVFEPFYTTKPFGSGTGLGLAVVASMVQAANGRIEVASASQNGTQFRIHLPLHGDAGDAPLAHGPAQERPSSGVAGEQIALATRGQ